MQMVMARFVFGKRNNKLHLGGRIGPSEIVFSPRPGDSMNYLIASER